MEEIIEINLRKKRIKKKWDYHPNGKPRLDAELLADMFSDDFTDAYRNSCVDAYNEKTGSKLPYVGDDSHKGLRKIYYDTLKDMRDMRKQ